MMDVMIPHVPFLSIDSVFFNLGGLLTSFIAQSPEEIQIHFLSHHHNPSGQHNLQKKHFV